MKKQQICILLIITLLLGCLSGFTLPVFAEDETQPCEHEYEQQVVPPSCTEQGYTLHTCVKCGESYQSDFVYELLHDWQKEGTVTKEATLTERGILTISCNRCDAVKERPLAAGNEKAHENEILFISDLHSGKKAENGYHNLRAMFRLLRENDDFIPEVVSGGGDYLESRTYDDADWPHSFEVLHDIMYQTSPDTVQVLGAGNHDWEWSRQSEEMLEKLLGIPRVCNSYSSESFEIFHIGAHMNGTGQEHFLDEDIEALHAFLDTVVGSGKVIFIHTHWPLHYGHNGSTRYTINADKMIDLLNEYSEELDICFVWGHNHNQDTMRHRYLGCGDELRITKTEYKVLQFTYVNAGCLNERHAKEGAGPSDSYYGPGYLLEVHLTEDQILFDYGHITNAYPDPEQAKYDHNSDLLYVPEIQEARPSHYEVTRKHLAECEHEYAHTVTPPTCTEQGFTTYTCTKCGNVVTEDLVAPLGHDLTHYEACAPTCTEPGWLAYDVCSRCDYTTYAELPAPGHDLINREGKAPTCTEPGWADYTVCSRCDYTTYAELPALGHDVINREGKAPTCTEPGWEDYTVCSRCDYTTYHALSALGHAWGEPGYRWSEDDSTVTASRVCGRDNAHVETEIAAVRSELTKAATLAEEGEITYTASFENPVFATQSKTVTVPKLQNPDGLPCDGGIDCPGGKFKDMPVKSHWSHDAIDWAIVRQITSGTGTDTFSPDAPCTRAQVVTFLWRAAGSPEVSDAGQSSPFIDVKESAYYEKAVRWAVEREITTGTGANKFSPNEACSRAQIVTFLWRAAGKPTVKDADSASPSEEDAGQREAEGINPFEDVRESSYYYDAVLWAGEHDITKGTSSTRFSPNTDCTRAQVVTFLYRSYH